jgi:DNA-binding transcriptional MerR regulator/quercetin dioxygenase-like cupin family protein
VAPTSYTSGVPDRTISQVSAEVGVSTQTLRVWETKGLLAPNRTVGGQRRYTDDHVRRAKQIADLRSTQGWNPAAIRVSLGSEFRADVAPQTSPWNGEIARKARLARGWTVKKAATKAGISPAHLSAIERNETGASTQVAAQLADAFQIPMSGLARFRAGDEVVVRKEDRARGELAGGVVWEELAMPGNQLEPAILTVPAGQGSGGAYSRRGESFALMLAGRMTFDLDERDPVDLSSGDSIVISAGVSFSWFNAGRNPARALWVEQLAPDAWATEEGSKLILYVRGQLERGVRED